MNTRIRKQFTDLIQYNSGKAKEVSNKIDLSRLLIVSDFDYTLTKKYSTEDEILNYTTFSLIENSSLISNEFKRANKELFSKYHKFEANYNLNEDFQKALMTEWFICNSGYLLDEKLRVDSFAQIAREAENRLVFREELKNFFKILLKHNIPLYIISAGLQDSVDALLDRDFRADIDKLKEKGLLISVGNKMLFDDKGENYGFDEHVYSFNKGEVIKDRIKHKDKEQFIIIGDNIWDVKALDYLNGDKLRIGYGNFKQTKQDKDKFKKFTDVYDLTIVNDGSFKPINDLLESKAKITAY